MPYTPIIGTLGFVMSPDQRRTLMVHRVARSDDAHFGKYNGLGGKLRPGEEVASGMRREILEEAGIVCLKLVLRGTVNWPGFGPQGEDWLGFIFRIDRFSGVPRLTNEEGDLSWQPVSELAGLPMWEGDRHFLPLVFDRDPRIFHGVMPYRDGCPQGWSFSRD
ncbi:MAG: 8-oxo-dGTP diphosphatase [Desulfobacteraceae bacterium]|nr:8-oxo-dGTP diphosphatase [Desulfobacteraceae bacterium]